MKLTNYLRSAFIRAVMDDVPDPRSEALEDEVQAALVKAMSPLCRKLYKQNPRALAREGNSSFSNRRHKYYTVGDANFEETVKPFMAKIEAWKTAKANLETVVNGCTTLKQLKTALPELEKYMPRENAPTANLPAVTNVVPALVALGWKA